MSTVTSRHHHSLRPDHLILVLRDVDSVPDEAAATAITEAQRHIAASTGYGVYIETVQNLIDVRVDVEVWDGTPDENPPGDWAGPMTFELDCPTGELLVGDDMGSAVDGINPPSGPGRYAVAVFSQGRTLITQAERDVLHALRAPDGQDRVTDLRTRHEGLERYLLRLWWQQELPDDSDDDL